MCAHFGGGERNSCEQMKTWLICIVQRTGTYRHSQWWSKPEASSVRADAHQVPDIWSWSVTGICRLLQTWGVFWWLVPRVGCSQSDINCQFLQQLTTPPNHLRHYGRWSLLTKRCKVGILNSWQYFLNTIGAAAQCSHGGAWPPQNVRVPFSGFHSRCPLRRGCSCDSVQLWGWMQDLCCLARAVVVKLSGRGLCWP